MKTPKVLSLKIATAPRYRVLAYGIVQSVSRGNRVNHTVVRRGLKWICSCEAHIFSGKNCKHIDAVRKVAARRMAA